ncbi:MAG TPA: hypothetical protein VF412_06090 [Bdellovibrio sp.]|uniref:hypothetical protein n=1 Tax=Bdellovibrio sp. TaxID=28201 RepID=UPI002EE114F2
MKTTAVFKALSLIILSAISTQAFADGSAKVIATCADSDMKYEILQAGNQISSSNISVRVTKADDGQTKTISDHIMVESIDNGSTLAVQAGFIILWVRQNGNSQVGVMLGSAPQTISCQIAEKPFVFDSSVHSE